MPSKQPLAGNTTSPVSNDAAAYVKMSPAYKQRWLDALRSKKYRQGKEHAAHAEDRFCCLGVLCDVIAPKRWKFSEALWSFNGSIALLPRTIAERVRLGEPRGGLSRRDERRRQALLHYRQLDREEPMNDNVAEPFRSILNKLWSLTAGWDPTALCETCEHARDVGFGPEPRCALGNVVGINGAPRMVLCEQMRAPGGQCEHSELYSPRR
jgi:hypothetical protein